MDAKTVAVMAGTPVDTQMGVDFLKHRNPEIQTLFCPTATDPREQTAFQLGPMMQKTLKIRHVLKKAKTDGADTLLVYCNSLSSALDFDALCTEERIRLVTPLMIHRKLALENKRLGVIAANNQSLYGIESTMFAANPNCDVIGISLLPVVLEIERVTPPEQIFKQFGMQYMLRFFETCKVDCVVLGCTHFPYLANILCQNTSLRIFNPDDAMYELLINY